MASRDSLSVRYSPEEPKGSLRKRITDQVKGTRGLLAALALGSAIGMGSDHHIDGATRNASTISRANTDVGNPGDREYADLSNEQLQQEMQDHFGEVDKDIRLFENSLTEYSGSRLFPLSSDLPTQNQSVAVNKEPSPVEFLTQQVHEALDVGDRAVVSLELAYTSALRRHHNNEEADEVQHYQDQVTAKHDRREELQASIHHASAELGQAEMIIRELIRRGVDKDTMTTMLRMVQQRSQSLESLITNMNNRWGYYQYEAER